MAKTYVLDTNVLLHNPDALFDFADNDIVLPFAVIEEIDDQKKRQDEIGRNARIVNRYLDELRSGGSLGRGVKLDNGGSVRIEVNNVAPKDVPKFFNLYKADNRILAVAMHLKKKSPGREVVLVSKDLNVRVKADTYEIKTEDYKKDRVEFGELYTGYSALELEEYEIEEIAESGFVELKDGVEAYPNHFFVCNRIGASPLIVRHKDGLLFPLKYQDKENWGIKPLNFEQMMAQELLMDDEIPVVTIIGKAGTGKTLLSLAVGMERVVNNQDVKCSSKTKQELRAKRTRAQYNKLIVARPTVPMGPDLGYLPGGIDEKIHPWMQPIYDNLCYMMRDCDDPMSDIGDLIKKGGLEIAVLTYIRGRSLPRQFIVCDEAQNMSPGMVKALVTRTGEDTKIVLTGDPEQIDTPFLDASSNGLSYLVERLKKESISGHVTLVKGERSKVAEVCSRVL